MSVCQYYLRGNCRYGERCRLPHGNSNEPRTHYPNDSSFRPRHPRHPRPSINPNYNYVAPSVVNQTNRNHHVENSTAPKTQHLKYHELVKWVTETFENKEKVLDILEQLQSEAKAWQKTEHLWRFTSRSLFPGGQPLKDWQDHSFEEVEWGYRCMKSQDQEHVYKKTYYDYITNTQRHLNGLATLRLDLLKSLKDYIDQYVASNYKPSKTLPTDIEMKDFDDNTTTKFVSAIESTNYTPDDQLFESERAAYASGTFEFGQIPVHAPSRQFC